MSQGCQLLCANLTTLSLSLCFQLLSLCALHESTKLPYQELCDALLCLTAERQRLLIASSASPSSPPLQDKDFAYINTSFQLNSLFSLNPDFVKSKQNGERYTNNIGK